MMKKVSVLIWAYNRPAWVVEAIESVLRQRGVDLEVIVLDNGSGPEVAEALDPYRADPRFIMLRNEVNGPSALATMATGDYITNLPDDDLLLGDDSLLRRVEMLEAHPACAFVFSSVRGHDADGKDLGVLPMGSIALHDVPSHAAPFDALFLDCFVPYPSGMYRNGFAVCTQQPAVTCCTLAQDWALWLRLSREADACYIAEPTVSLRIHAGQHTARGNADGGFVRDHLALWKFWVENGHIPTIPDVHLMSSTMEGLLKPHQIDSAPSHGRVYRDPVGLMAQEWEKFKGVLETEPVRPYVTLVLIVKDEKDSHEGHVIRRCLDSCDSLIDKVVAVFTSEVGKGWGPCQSIVSDWGMVREVPMSCRCAVWDGDFSRVRNIAMRLAAQSFGYNHLLLMIDCDEVLNADTEELWKRMASLNTNAFILPTVMNDGSIGMRVNLVKNSPGAWSYEGAMHENLRYWGHTPKALFLGDKGKATNGPHVSTPGDGARSLDPMGLDRDIKAMREHQDGWRDKFFLAMLLAHKNERLSDDEALGLFCEVAIRKLLPEERGFKYTSLLMRGRLLLRRTDDIDSSAFAHSDFEEAYKLCPTRVEALGELAQMHAKAGDWPMCRLYALACANAPEPDNLDYLEPHWGRWRGLQILGGALLMLGQYVMARAYYHIILKRDDVPQDVRDGVVQILQETEHMK